MQGRVTRPLIARALRTRPIQGSGYARLGLYLYSLLLAPAEVVSCIPTLIFDRRPRPLIDRKQLAWPVETDIIIAIALAYS